MPLIYAFPRSMKKPPRYSVAPVPHDWQSDTDLWRILEDGQPLGIVCATEGEALAVAGALNFKRDILRHTLPIFFLAPGPQYVN